MCKISYRVHTCLVHMYMYSITMLDGLYYSVHVCNACAQPCTKWVSSTCVHRKSATTHLISFLQGKRPGWAFNVFTADLWVEFYPISTFNYVTLSISSDIGAVCMHVSFITCMTLNISTPDTSHSWCIDTGVWCFECCSCVSSWLQSTRLSVATSLSVWCWIWSRWNCTIVSTFDTGN